MSTGVNLHGNGPDCRECCDLGGHWQHHPGTDPQRTFTYCPAQCHAAAVRWLLNLICDQDAAYADQVAAGRRDRLDAARAWADETRYGRAS